jgi:hypothetical protein
MREKEVEGQNIIRPLFVPISIAQGSKADKIRRTIGAFIRDTRAFFKPEMRELFMQMDSFNPHSKDNDDDILDAASMMMQTVEYFAPSQWQNVQDYQFGKNEYSLTFDDLFKKAPKAWWGGKFVYGH